MVLIHVNASYWQECSSTALTFEWEVLAFYNGLSRWSVPAFVMISGALLMGREISLRQLYTKRILRILASICFWSLLFALWDSFLKGDHSAGYILKEFLYGHYHMWYLYMIVGIYMISPLLNLMIKNIRLSYYFVILFLLYAVISPQFCGITGHFIPALSESLNKLIGKQQMQFVIGYSGYFVLGYLLNRAEIGKKTERVVYVLGFLGLLSSFVMTVWFSAQDQSRNQLFYDNFSINTFIVTVAVFVFFKQHLNRMPKTKKGRNLLLLVSKCSFGVYLIHPLFIDVLDRFLGITIQSFHQILSVPALSAVVFLASLGASILINKIPLINKWIV